jgi:hypothetical protein
MYGVLVVCKNFCKGCSPASTADDTELHWANIQNKKPAKFRRFQFF